MAFGQRQKHGTEKAIRAIRNDSGRRGTESFLGRPKRLPAGFGLPDRVQTPSGAFGVSENAERPTYGRDTVRRLSLGQSG